MKLAAKSFPNALDKGKNLEFRQIIASLILLTIKPGHRREALESLPVLPGLLTAGEEDHLWRK
jgi:hypothetical protein